MSKKSKKKGNKKKKNNINSKIKNNKKEIVNNKTNNQKIIKDTKSEKKEIEEIKEKKLNKSFFKDTFIRNLFFVTFIIFFIEILFRAISNFELLDYATLRIFLSSFLLSLIVTFLSGLTKRKWLRNTINLLFIFIYSIYTWLQLGFINYLGVYISFNTSSQLGAVTDYVGDYFISFKLIYFTIFYPFIGSVIYYLLLRKREYHKLKFTKRHLFLIPTMIISVIFYYLTLTLPFMQNEFQIKNNKKLFVNPDVPTVAVNQFGTTVFGILDFKTFLFPIEEDEIFEIGMEDNKEPVNREVSPFLEELNEIETDKKYTDLNKYFASQSITDYNEYTGMFEGKNVIVILMESVNEAIINEEYFPNFTKLYNEGWHWINNYSPRNSCATGNNEFSAMTGLYSIYNTCTSNVYKENTYYESIFRLFEDKGYNTSSMHNFSEWYYKRSTIHTNMYSGAYYGPKELGIKTPSYYGEWTSDVEFFEKAFDIVLKDDSDKPFMTWLTTVSSHQPYSSSSTYGDMYKNEFKKLGYSTAVSRYLSKLKVVDNAIKVMIDKLIETDKLNDTVIVLLADHYPYGLNQSYISEMIDHDLKDYEIEKTPLVIYNPEMEAKTFTEYSSYINLVPTIANLMNLDYDPRLYMGSDLLSEDYESRVVFADGSWKNEIAYYNASTSKIKYYGEEIYTNEKIQEINNEVGLQIAMSSKAIKNNYFNYLEKKLEEYNLKEENIDKNNKKEENIQG